METSVAALSAKIREYVTQLFKDYQTPELVYHNLEHTLTVVTISSAIATNYSLSEDERFTLFAAAWFQDTGQLFAAQDGHEAVSVRVMKRYFSSVGGVFESMVSQIESCILATKIPQSPHSVVAEILCDADIYHIGTADFKDVNELVYKETKLRGGNVENWQQKTIAFLKKLNFHTECCRQKLNEGKARNIAALMEAQ